MDSDDRQEMAERLLGVKVCLQEILEVPGLGDHEDAFDRALDAALQLEADLGLDE